MKRKSVLLHQPDRTLWTFQSDIEVLDGKLLDTKGFGYIKLYINTVAGDFLEILSQVGNVEDAYEKMADKYDVSIEEVREKFAPFIRQLKEYGFEVNNPGLYQWDIRGSREYHLPIHLALELTYSCNLRCKHCYNRSGSDRRVFMDYEKFKRLVDNSVEIGVVEFEITGGEPTVHPRFLDMVEYILQKEVFSVAILSNGTLWTEEWVKRLLPYKDKVLVQIDLHGLDKEYVAWFTGWEHSLERQKRTIELFSKYGIPFRVVAVITPKSVKDMPEILAYAKEKGAVSSGISIPMPMGRAEDYEKEILFSPEEMSEYMKIYEEQKSQYGMFMYDLRDISDKDKINCGVGDNLSITPDFGVKICSMSDFEFGRISDYEFSWVDYVKNIDLPGILKSTKAPGKDESCSRCNDVGTAAFCYGCITRGVKKALEDPDRCHWIKGAGKELWELVEKVRKLQYSDV